MELHEYPRPANDTGIGIHWSVGFASAVGMGRIRDFWIPELKAMGVKWVKIGNHDGAIDFAELLLSEGIMPVVRIFRPSPNPGVLDVRELVHLDALVRVGVRYFEFNNEPDQDSEWKGGRVPANGLDLVVEHTIANMETILERGGMPAIPALSNGCRWDLVGKIVARGRRDLFDGPVWQAIHNYSLNRPMDYPYDIGNQEGAAYTQRFYAAIASERWQEDSWRGRALSEVNQLRVDRCNPGATIMDDHTCWLAYEYFDARNRRHIGHSIPVLSTECGYLVGEDTDPRYPATSPDLHMAQTLESCRVIMGTSERFAAAPDYYFCTAFWLLGNAALGNSSTWCEPHAWYSDRWPGKVLPIVPALKAEPKSVRRWKGMAEVGSRSVLRGAVRHAGERRSLVLEKGGAEVAHVTVDAQSRYVIPDLLPGNYTLRVEGTTISEQVSLLPGQEEATLDLDLSEINAQVSASMVTGTVRGGAGAVVLLLRTGDGEEWVTMAKDDGSFRFVDLPPGVYNVRVQDEGTRRDGISLDGIREVDVELAVAGWGHTVRPSGRTGASGAICVSVEGQANRIVRAHSGDWTSEPAYLGSAPEFGPDAAVISPLEPGHYIVAVEGVVDKAGSPVGLEAYVHLAGKEMPLVEFVHTQVEQLSATRRSSIQGRVVGGCGPGHDLHVWLYDDQANRYAQAVREDCSFSFEDLPAGHYSVEVVGYADVASRSDIALDGENSVAVELYIPVASEADRAGGLEGKSVISGTVPDSVGKLARLVDAVGNERKQKVSLDDGFYFDELDSGVYSLTVEGGYEQPHLEVDGRSGLFVEFQPLVSTWEANASPAGSMPGYSVVRVEVEGMRGLPVYIWKDDWEGMMRRTGSKPEYGECAVEFSPLGPGTYMIEPEGLGIWADVELTGLEAVWLDFRRKAVPSSPNVVTELPGGFDEEMVNEPVVSDGDADLPFRPIVREPITPEPIEPERSEAWPHTWTDSSADENRAVADEPEHDAYEWVESESTASAEEIPESRAQGSGPDASAEREPESFAWAESMSPAYEPDSSDFAAAESLSVEFDDQGPEPDVEGFLPEIVDTAVDSAAEFDEASEEIHSEAHEWPDELEQAADFETEPEQESSAVIVPPDTTDLDTPDLDTTDLHTTDLHTTDTVSEQDQEIGPGVSEEKTVRETSSQAPDRFDDAEAGENRVSEAEPSATSQTARKSWLPADPTSERTCVLLMTTPESIDTMRRLLLFVSEARASIVSQPEEAYSFDKVILVGDSAEERVQAALAQLYDRGITPITDLGFLTA